MSAVDDLLNRAIRRDLRNAQDKQAQALHRQDEPAQRRAAKSVALYVSKLLCPHSFIEMKRMRVRGRDKFAYKCIACKAYNLSDTKL